MTGLVQTFRQLVVCRILLGIFEAGLLYESTDPYNMYCISLIASNSPSALASRCTLRSASVRVWTRDVLLTRNYSSVYTKQQLALRIGYLFVAAALAGACGARIYFLCFLYVLISLTSHLRASLRTE
jgi:hypothetical protein